MPKLLIDLKLKSLINLESEFINLLNKYKNLITLSPKTPSSPIK